MRSERQEALVVHNSLSSRTLVVALTGSESHVQVAVTPIQQRAAAENSRAPAKECLWTPDLHAADPLLELQRKSSSWGCPRHEISS
ncbi:hypothetical protein R1flu_007250 [Riccia fluitans]|uniref:Uncharacterized protein n=1 Tax=Riccia fluitans TaxID=41844 RepID=A0ABD1YYD0_9MARC